ncbi:hypothetical protein [Saccharothrix sp. ST-888]|uniref:hypothetical protein n=1 Tax=Saccharothrix sp. ST-888 TaxID=1427391 RepID=UPI0005ECD04A|nr:hypothetical protein [Saccharothrix sp. ST-888]KJK56644.1 hypothetical protein UK12_21375 [Saccharothrix sp. ST-888]
MDYQRAHARKEAAKRLRDVLWVLLPGLGSRRVGELRAALGDEWPELPPALLQGPGPVDPPTDPAAAARAVRESLAGPRRGGLAALVAEARTAGALDAALALELVERARPARLLPGLVEGADDPAGLVAARLGDLLRRRLGGVPERWLAVQAALPSHRGTVPELLAEAELTDPGFTGPELTAGSEPPAAGPTAVQSSAARPTSGEPAPPPRSADRALAFLLGHADPADLATVLPRLSDRTVTGILAGGALPFPGLCAAVAAHGDTRTRSALARHPRADARLLKQLVTADDPTVNVLVYRHPRATPSLRRTIAGGTPHTPGRTEPVPVDAAALLAAGDLPQTALPPLICSGDPELTALGLSAGLRKAADQYALLQVWERRGPAAVRAMLDDPAIRRTVHSQIAEQVAAALDDPDGLRRLRAQGEPYHDPAELVRRLQKHRGTDTLRSLLSEPYVQDFRAIVAGHLASPYMPTAVEVLIRHEDATDEDRRLFRTTLLNDCWRVGDRIVGNPTPPGERLAAEELDGLSEYWALECVRNGLLDPARLVDTARPAARAAACLRRLAAEDGLPGPVAERVSRLAAEHLGRPASWVALLEGLTDFPGTFAELLAHAGAAEPSGRPLTAVPAWAREEAEHIPPTAPSGWHERAALAAVDLLITLGRPSEPATGPGRPPVPEDEGVLGFLARTDPGDRPGRLPGWLAKAWPQAVDQEEPKPTVACADAEYLFGHTDGDDVLAAIAARLLSPPVHAWQERAFVPAAQRALARLLEKELGTDPQSWLRLLTVAQTKAETTRLGWPELLEESRTAEIAAPQVLTPPLPESRADQLRRLRSWDWPAGEALLHASVTALEAVMPGLPPHTPRLLALYVNVHDRYPAPVLEYLAAHGDAATVRELAELRYPGLPAAQVQQLLERADPEVNLALLRHHGDRKVQYRAAVHPVGGLADLVGPVDDYRMISGLRSPDPAMVEAVFARAGSFLTLPEQFLGAFQLLCCGGSDRLAALLDTGLVGPAVTKACRKALAAADPVQVLRARTEREFTAEKLAAKLHGLRRWDHSLVNRYLTQPYQVDWALLEAEHAREPFEVWSSLINHPDTPEEVALRHHDVLADTGRILPQDTPALFAARMRNGLARCSDGDLAVLLDEALGRGLLTGHQLIHDAVPAARVLRYLSGALERSDAPGEQIQQAAGTLLDLVRAVEDPAAWQRIYGGLTGRHAGWVDRITVAELIRWGADGQM